MELLKNVGRSIPLGAARVVLTSIVLALCPSMAWADNSIAITHITQGFPDGFADQAVLSDDGRYIAFTYFDRTSSRRDVFLHDRVTASAKRISQTSAGEPGNGQSRVPVISGDGRFVVFNTNAMNLGAPSPGGSAIVRYDHASDTLETIVSGPSSSTDPTNLNMQAYAAISVDGRYVAYRQGINGAIKIKVRDTVTTTTLDTGAIATAWGIGDREFMHVSSDGRYISYPDADTLGDTPYVYDRATGIRDRTNASSSGERAAGGSGTAKGKYPSMSADGRFAVFASVSSNLVPGDVNGRSDVFIRDRVARTTEMISLKTGSGASQSAISSSGRYAVFNGSGIPAPGEPYTLGLFVHDFVTKTARRIPASSLSMYPAISGDGRFVAYRGDDQLQLADLGPRRGIVVSTTSLSLTEGGAAGTYTLALSVAPTADVTITVTPDAQVVASPTQLTFTSANWNIPQTVSVTAVQDGIAEGEHLGKLTHQVTSADPAYQVETAADVSAQITDTVATTISLSIPAAVWTQADLPVHGTAAPGATVLVSAAHLGNGAITAVSAVADANGDWSATLPGLADGSYELQAEADAIQSNKLTVAVDSHAPVSTITLSASSAPSADGWYATPVLLRIDATDGAGGQGVARSEYRIDDGVPATMPPSGATVAVEGIHSVCYWSVDRANNAETPRCVSIAVDTTAPQVTPAFNTITNRLAVTGVDGGSGLLGIDVSLDGGATWAALTGDLGFARDGSHTVHYRARDKAGNQSLGQVTVVVATPPAIATPGPQTGVEATSTSFDIGSFTDQEADSPWAVEVDWGDSTARDSFTAASPGAIGTRPHLYADSGTYTVSVTVRDGAGSMATKTFQVTVSNIAPTAELRVSGPLAEGSPVAVALVNGIDPSGADLGAGLHHAFSCDGSTLAGASYANSTADPVSSCIFPDNGSHSVHARIIDKDEGYTEYTLAVTIGNVAPTANLFVGGPVQEGSSAAVGFNGTSDPSSMDMQAGLRYAFACGGASLDGATYANSGASPSAACTFPDGPASYQVRGRVLDKDGAFTDYAIGVDVTNVAPVLGSVALSTATATVNTPVTASASFSDAGVVDTHLATVDWGNGVVSPAAVSEVSGAGTATATHSYASAGIYRVTVAASDKDGATAVAISDTLVVTDPSGSVNGKGTFDSPAGAMPTNPGLGGKASLQLRADYNGGNLMGSMEFDFSAGAFLFESTGYEWLVAAGEKAIVRGAGTVNGTGSYTFMVTVVDGGNGQQVPDLVRIKIWDQATGTVVYDNQPGASDTANPNNPLTKGKFSVK